VLHVADHAERLGEAHDEHASLKSDGKIIGFCFFRGVINGRAER